MNNCKYIASRSYCATPSTRKHPWCTHEHRGFFGYSLHPFLIDFCVKKL